MEELLWLAYSSGYLVFAIIFLLIAKKVFDILTPYSINVQMTEKDNPAIGIMLVGFLLGVAAVICGLFAGPTVDEPTLGLFLDEMIEVAIYGAIGIVLLLIAGKINDTIILRMFSNRKEIIEKQNKAVAIVVASTYIGSGLIIAGGVKSSVDIFSMLVAFAVGQIALVVFAIIYQKSTSYNDQKELGERKNSAAGLAFGGNILAYALILMKGLVIDTAATEPWTWHDRLRNLGYYAIAGLVLLVIARVVNDVLFFPKVKITKEIVEDRNTNAGLMEAAIAVSMGSAMVFCL